MKRLLFLTIVLSFAIVISGCSSSEMTDDSESIQSYKDIPGITEEEISSIEKLKESRDSFSYGHLILTEAFMQPDGTYEGFTIEFCDLLTDLFGIEFIHEPYDEWDYLIKDLDSQKLDFTGGLTTTREHMKRYYMTYAIAERSLKIYYHEDSPDFTTEADVNGKNIGFFTGRINDEYVKKFYPTVNYEVVELDNVTMAAEKIKAGEIDAFVSDAVYEATFENFDFIKSNELFLLAYSPVSMSTANAELEPVISVVSKYIEAGGIDTLYEIYKDGDFEYAKSTLKKSFTDEENAYLEKLASQKKDIKIGFEIDNYPFCFYNNQEEEYQGIAIDVLSEISKLIGIQFEPEENTKTADYAELLNKLKADEIPMVTQLLITNGGEADLIWSKLPYATSRFALLSKQDYPYLQLYQVARTKVGTIDGTGYAEIYPVWFPNNNNLILYSTLTEAFAALEHGKIDLLMVTDYNLYYQINYLEKPNYKINIVFDAELNSHFGFHENETILCSIVDKAMNYISVDSIENEWTNKVFDYSQTIADSRNTYLTIVVLILVIALISVFYLFLSSKKAKEEARQASKAKSAFLAHMSHEIRTPLNAVIGMANVAKLSISNEKKVLNSIHQITVSSHHLLSVLNNILDMSKIESGNLELSNEPFSLLESCDSVSSMIKNRCQDKKINFVTNVYEMADITLIGDKLRINQVLINLLGNAVKFTDRSGEIEFRIHILEENTTDVRIKYEIIDNGAGISKEQIEKLFIPFSQADSSISAKYGGTGLGLSISQNLVTMMGGEIKVISTLNSGSNFYFELFFQKGSGKIVTSKDDELFLDLTGKRILLVEDIEINYEIIKELLASTGVLIDVALDGSEAVHNVLNSPEYYYDLIFMDIQMPVMNGHEATREIRKMKREDTKIIPIIAMTANAYKEDVDKAILAGMNGHLSKPIDINALSDMLKKFLED